MDYPSLKHNIGKIAERIVANELEARGFRVSDLNKDGLSANADLIAAGHNTIWQIQVKGATNTVKDGPWWWIEYGFCNYDVINKHEPMFNRKSSFYKADIIVLVAVRAPHEYCCIVLPVEAAERAAQLNLNRDYRVPTRRGAPKQPHKVWVGLDPRPKEKIVPLRDKERQILRSHRDNWEILLSTQTV